MLRKGTIETFFFKLGQHFFHLSHIFCHFLQLLKAKKEIINCCYRRATPLCNPLPTARIEDLIKAGANLSAKSEQDQTALQFAESQSNSEMVELLKRHGAQ